MWGFVFLIETLITLIWPDEDGFLTVHLCDFAPLRLSYASVTFTILVLWKERTKNTSSLRA